MISPRTHKEAATTLSSVQGKGRKGSPRPARRNDSAAVIAAVTQRLAAASTGDSKTNRTHPGSHKLRHSPREPQGASLDQGYSGAAIRGEHAPTVAIARMDGRRQEVIGFPAATDVNRLATQEPSRFRTKGYPENGER